MNIAINKLKMPLLFIGYFLICSIQSGYAFEPYKGEVLTNVNLREAPALDGNIITRLRKGDKIIIKNELNGWYQILLDTKAFGYKGWVYAKYIRKVQSNKEIKALGFKGEIVETPIEPPVSKSPLKYPLAIKREINEALNTQLIKAPLEKNPIEIATELKPQESAADIKPRETAVDIKLHGTAIEKEPPKNTTIKKITIYPHLDAREEVAKEIINPENSFPQSQKTNGGKPLVPSNTEGYDRYENGKLLIKFVLNLSSVILSCIALLLSYKAFQLVNSIHKKTYAISTESTKSIYLGKVL